MHCSEPIINNHPIAAPPLFITDQSLCAVCVQTCPDCLDAYLNSQCWSGLDRAKMKLEKITSDMLKQKPSSAVRVDDVLTRVGLTSEVLWQACWRLSWPAWSSVRLSSVKYRFVRCLMWNVKFEYDRLETLSAPTSSWSLLTLSFAPLSQQLEILIILKLNQQIFQD